MAPRLRPFFVVFPGTCGILKKAIKIMKRNTTLVIGGCRSGKSSHALDMANQVPGDRKLFIATSVPSDGEMEKRVEKHRCERGDLWRTAETPVNVADVIEQEGDCSDVILLDCITLWISNLFGENFEESTISQQVDGLVHAVTNAPCPVFLVSNEVGTGIVPDNALARQFRDAAGFANQRIAAAVSKVIWTVAGIPVTIKS